jgi:enoyl-CoA hydratase/carnithine racemase
MDRTPIGFVDSAKSHGSAGRWQAEPSEHEMTSTDFTQILYQVERQVATVTLNRPDKLNAWTLTMSGEVREAMRRARDDKGVRAIILTGAGRGFCAGADMGLLGQISQDLVGHAPPQAPPFDPASSADFHGPDSYFPVIEKPILCALNGVAAGIGFVYALYCDLRFASDSAYVMTAFAKRGAIAEHGTSWLLPRLVGMPNAFDLLYSSRRVQADEALRMGLVNRVVPNDSLMDSVRDYAEMLATQCSPRSLAVMKRQVWTAQTSSLGADVITAQAEMMRGFDSEDFREGVAHFVEKRPPRFTGR